MERRITFTSGNTDYMNCDRSSSGMAFEIGSIVNLKYISLNLGMTILQGFEMFGNGKNDETFGTIHFGIGYMF